MPTDFQDQLMKEKKVYSRSLQTDIKVGCSMDSEPEHQDANRDSKQN